jgi:hypothetical protein
MNALSRLSTFAARNLTKRCALCGAPIGEPHPHLVDGRTGKLSCSCPGCATVFDHSSGKFRRVPDRVARLTGLRMSDDRWQSLGVPVGVAFFQKRSADGRVVAFYPSPLGAVESAVEPEAWEALAGENPGLRSMETDIEALLVRRQDKAREEFIAPLDACFALIGILRREWRGFSGGDGVVSAVETFFEGLRARSGGTA